MDNEMDHSAKVAQLKAKKKEQWEQELKKELDFQLSQGMR
jgi:hypothetical protein